MFSVMMCRKITDDFLKLCGQGGVQHVGQGGGAQVYFWTPDGFYSGFAHDIMLLGS